MMLFGSSVELMPICTEVLDYLNANKQYSTLAAIYRTIYDKTSDECCML